MTRSIAMLCAMLSLAGCERGSSKAIRQAEMVERSGDPEAICEAKRKVAEAFLSEEDKGGYALYKGAADAYCMNSRLKLTNGG